MYDLIAVGNVNVDLFFRGQSLTQKDGRFYLAIGGKYEVGYFHDSLGGGAANVAVSAAHFGLTTAVVGRIGENGFKQMIIQKLAKRTVSCEFLTVGQDSLNLSVIFLTEAGERTIVHYCSHGQPISFTDEMMTAISRTKALYMGNWPAASLTEKKRLLTFLKRKGVFVGLNLGITDCRRRDQKVTDLIAIVDLLILNAHEFAELVGKQKTALKLSQNCARMIGFDDKILVVTDGADGSYLYHKSKVYFQKASTPKKIVDTTGAGDAYTAAFLASYLNNQDLPKAMAAGAAYAAVIIGRVGAQ